MDTEMVQRQLQDETRNIEFFGFGASYIRDLTVLWKSHYFFRRKIYHEVVMTLSHENDFRITGPGHEWIVSKQDLYCGALNISLLSEGAVQQTFDLPVIWDGITLMWPYYNGTIYIYISMIISSGLFY